MTQRTEPCLSCHEDTSTGSTLYSDRLVDHSGGDPRYLCSLCVRQASGSREQHEMTDDLRNKLETGAFAFGSFAPGGH